MCFPDESYRSQDGVLEQRHDGGVWPTVLLDLAQGPDENTGKDDLKCLKVKLTFKISRSNCFVDSFFVAVHREIGNVVCCLAVIAGLLFWYTII